MGRKTVFIRRLSDMGYTVKDFGGYVKVSFPLPKEGYFTCYVGNLEIEEVIDIGIIMDQTVKKMNEYLKQYFQQD